VLSGDAASGNVHYHRTLYPHGEDQSLRFQSGAHSYVIFNALQTPDYRRRARSTNPACWCCETAAVSPA
jgi:hypothetical protein